jgi:regulator of nonsense transcripts 3
MAPVTPSTNGVLPVSATVLQKQSSHNNTRGASRKGAGPRLKVVIRRLAPGLTEAEFQNALGEEWKLGAGKVDWFEYHAGKASKEYV